MQKSYYHIHKNYCIVK